jgi:hypothetical protein
MEEVPALGGTLCQSIEKRDCHAQEIKPGSFKIPKLLMIQEHSASN